MNNKTKVPLPPVLCHAGDGDCYTADQMIEYGNECRVALVARVQELESAAKLALMLLESGEPFAYVLVDRDGEIVRDSGSDTPWFALYKDTGYASQYEDGCRDIPLFTHPAPAKQPLSAERAEIIAELRSVVPHDGNDARVELMRKAADMLAADAQAIPTGYALVPIKMNPAMNDITDQDDWQWADLLAAAEAITEDQYNESQAQQVAVPQVKTLTARQQRTIDRNRRGMEIMTTTAPHPPQAAQRVTMTKHEISAAFGEFSIDAIGLNNAECITRRIEIHHGILDVKQ